MTTGFMIHTGESTYAYAASPVSPLLPDDPDLFHRELSVYSEHLGQRKDPFLRQEQQDPYYQDGEHSPLVEQEDDEQSELSFSSAFGTPSESNPAFSHHTRETTV